MSDLYMNNTKINPVKVVASELTSKLHNSIFDEIESAEEELSRSINKDRKYFKRSLWKSGARRRRRK